MSFNGPLMHPRERGMDLWRSPTGTVHHGEERCSLQSGQHEPGQVRASTVVWALQEELVAGISAVRQDVKMGGTGWMGDGVGCSDSIQGWTRG